MLNENGTTSQSSHQLNLALVHEIVILPLEAIVRLLLNLKHNIAGLHIWRLITITLELDASTAAHTLVDVQLKHLAINDRLFAIAVLALVLFANQLALTVAVWADRLESLNHGTHLAHHVLDTMALTASALLHSTALAAKTFALGTDDGPLKGELGNLAAVDVLKGDLVGVMNGTSLARASVLHAAKHATKTATTATATKELGKEILGSHAATTTTTSGTLKAGLTILIVGSALLWVGQDFVGVRNLLELFLGRRVVCILVLKERERRVASELVMLMER